MIGIGERNNALMATYLATRGKTAAPRQDKTAISAFEPVKLTVDASQFVINDTPQINESPQVDVQKLSTHVLGEIVNVQRLREGLAASTAPPLEIQLGEKTLTIPAAYLTKNGLLGALEQALKGLPLDHGVRVAPLQAVATPLIQEMKGLAPPPADMDSFMQGLQQLQDPKEFDKYAKGFLEGKLGLKSVDTGFIATYLFDALKGDSISKQIRGLGFVMVRAHEVIARSPALKGFMDAAIAKVAPHIPDKLKPVFEKMFTQKGPSLGHIQNLYVVVNADKDLDKVLNDPNKSDFDKMQAYSKIMYATYELVHHFGSDVKGLLPPRMQQTIDRMEFMLGDKFREHVTKAVKDWLPQGANSEFAIAMFKFTSSDTTARIAATLDLVKLTGLKLFGDGGKFASLMGVIKVDIDTTIYVRQLLDPASPPELKAKAFKSIADIYKLRLDKLAERFSPSALPPTIVADAAKLATVTVHSGMVKTVASHFGNLSEEAAAEAVSRLAAKGFDQPEDMIKVLTSTGLDLAGKSGPEFTSLLDQAVVLVEQANKFGALAPNEILRTLNVTGARSAEALLGILDGRADQAASLAKECLLSPEAEKSLVRLVQNGQMSDEALATLMKLGRELGPGVMEKSLQVLVDIRPSVAARLLEHRTVAANLMKGLAKLVPELEQLGVKAAVLAPKVAQGLVKALPALGVVTAAGDMVRTKTIALTGQWQELTGDKKLTTYNDNSRRFAAIAATLNTYDTALGLAEFIPGVAVASLIPQIGLALGEATMDILTDYYNTHPLPEHLKTKLEVAAYAAAIAGLDPVTTVALLKMDGAAKDAFLQALQDAIQQGKVTLGQAETYLKAVAAQIQDKDLTTLVKDGLKLERLIQQNAATWIKKADDLLVGAKGIATDAAKVVHKADVWLKKSDELLDVAKHLGSMGKDEALQWLKQMGQQIESLQDILKNATEPTLKALAERLSNVYETTSKAVAKWGSKLGQDVVEQLTSLAGFARSALTGLAAHTTDVAKVAQKLLCEVESRLTTKAESVAKTVANIVQEAVEGFEKRGQALLKELESLGSMSKAPLDELLAKGEKYLDDLQSLIAKYGDEAKPLLDQLTRFYERAGEMMGRVAGASQELLSKLGKRAGDALETISKQGGALATFAAEHLSKVRTLFQTVVKNPTLLAELVTKIGLNDEALQTLGKVVGHLDGEELKVAMQAFEELGVKNAERVIKLMGYLPSSAAKQALKVPGMLKGITSLLEGLERAGMKSIDYAQLGAKLSKGLQKAVPALGALMAGYDTVRTISISTTGQWTEALSGKTIRYNEDARALAYIASKLNTVDMVLGVAEFIPGVGAVSAFPQIMLAIGETALDYMMDHYNEPQHTMSSEMRNYVEAAAIATAVATCDPVGLTILYENSGKMAEKSGTVLAQMLAEGRHSPAKMESFIQELSKSWTSNDNATRALFQALEKQGVSLANLMKKEPPALTQLALQMLFDNLDSATAGAEPTDYDQMLQLAQVGSTRTRVHIIQRLMDQQTNSQEETVIYEILKSLPDKGFEKLLFRLPVTELAKELENPAQQLAVLKRITQLGTPQQFKDFTANMSLEQLQAAIEGGLKLSDQQRLALFSRFTDAGHFAMVDALMNGSHGLIRVQDTAMLQKMTGYLASHINTFMHTLGNPEQAGQVAAWIMAYGDQSQIDRVFQHVKADEWFGAGSDVIRKAMDLAEKQGVSLHGKLSLETLKALVGTLNSGWTKAFRLVGGSSHQENEKYLYRLAQMANIDGKAMILQDLMQGWTPGSSETIVQNILLETKDRKQFTALVDRLGPATLSRELENRQELGRVMAAIVSRYQGDVGAVLTQIMGQWNRLTIQSDDILYTMLKRLEKEGQLDKLKPLPNEVLTAMIDWTDDAFRDGNICKVDAESQWSIDILKAAHHA